MRSGFDQPRLAVLAWKRSMKSLTGAVAGVSAGVGGIPNATKGA
jgi:hypothetical protein